MSKLDMQIARQITFHDPNGQLDQTAKVIQALARINHSSTLEHMQRVALMSEAVAKKRGWDQKAAFFGGLLHDIAKLVLPSELFDGHDIDANEYTRIKTHATNGFKILKSLGHNFTAMCAGLHHAIYAHGYGVTTKDFPKEWDIMTAQKVLNLSAVISICDFIDAATHRSTRLHGNTGEDLGLREMLYEKYPNNSDLIDIALGSVIE